MTRITLLAAAAVTALAFAAQSGAARHVTKLQGDVGPGFSIHLKKNGQTVKTLPAGSYSITVSDKSPIHNFHLTGPGVNKQITSVSFSGSKTVTVTLKKGGTYKYVCDPHSSTMHGSFKVT
jgi:plastocyanin